MIYIAIAIGFIAMFVFGFNLGLNVASKMFKSKLIEGMQYLQTDDLIAFVRCMHTIFDNYGKENANEQK